MLERNLRFLQWILHAEEESVSGSVCAALCDDIMSLSLVKECRELEEMCDVAVTDKMVRGDMVWSRSMKDDIMQEAGPLKDAEEMHKRSTFHCGVEVEEKVGWARLWDASMDLGVCHIRGLQFLSRAMSHHGRGCRPCPLCNVTPLDRPVLEHIMSAHQDALHLNYNTEQMVERLAALNLSFLDEVQELI